MWNVLEKLTIATPKELIDLHWCDTQNAWDMGCAYVRDERRRPTQYVRTLSGSLSVSFRYGGMNRSRTESSRTGSF
eukprot:COSAG01_NODE_67565_length_266_cov_1.784431_1_plen_75_part_10